MQPLPFDVTMELDGWSLFWAHLSTGGDNSGLDDLRIAVASEVRERFADTASISKHPPVAAMRSLFRSAGCDPTRYRPASEALLRRLVKGAELPRIHPLVDLNNCLSARLAAPCCVMAEGSIGTSFVFRSGREGESYESLRGPFNLEAKPLLLDEHGPLDTPITGGVRVKVAPDTKCAWLVAYLPAAEISQADAWREVESMVGPTSVSAESFSPL